MKKVSIKRKPAFYRSLVFLFLSALFVFSVLLGRLTADDIWFLIIGLCALGIYNMKIAFSDVKPENTAEFSECVNGLLNLYDRSRGGFGYGSDAAKPVIDYGNRLNKLGGFELMLKAHKEFSQRCPHLGAARNLEQIWDGIGSWRG